MDHRKLYYADSHLKEFSATVTGCTETKGGWAVTVDATAFYPTGGGQNCDLGTLGGANVLDVKEQAEEIIHLCDAPLQIGSTVKGAIDWERRFDHMQQHSGEHLVMGQVYQKFGYHNVGFHMGTGLVTIDLDGPVSWEDLLEIESNVNRIIWENRPVKTWYPSAEELPTVNYRSKKALPWPVRIVEFSGADVCACCGTHVKFTGEIGMVKFVSCIKFKEGVRIEMASGKRAMELFRNIFEQNRQVSQTFSAKILETGAAAKKFNELLNQEKYRATGLQRKLFAAIAAGYAGKAQAVHFEEGLNPGSVRELADAIAEKAQTAIVYSGTDDAGYSICIISKTADTRELGKAVNARLNGRGGGKPGAFQGSIQASKAQIEAFFA
jgi:alanyl-tRNA synthetase